MTTLLGEKTIEMMVYIWVFDRIHLLDLDYSSPIIWLITALAYDLGYYVTHRIGHEWNFMWAAHQTHHSSEYYNLSTALRQSMWHKYTTFPAFIPMALIGIPPSQMLLHRFGLYSESSPRHPFILRPYLQGIELALPVLDSYSTSG